MSLTMTYANSNRTAVDTLPYSLDAYLRSTWCWAPDTETLRLHDLQPHDDASLSSSLLTGSFVLLSVSVNVDDDDDDDLEDSDDDKDDDEMALPIPSALLNRVDLTLEAVDDMLVDVFDEIDDDDNDDEGVQTVVISESEAVSVLSKHRAIFFTIAFTLWHEYDV